MLTISRISTLYTSPIDNCPQIQALLKQQSERAVCSESKTTPLFPFTFGLYMLHCNAEDDFEVPLATAKDHCLLYDHDSATQHLLRFYRMIYSEEAQRCDCSDDDARTTMCSCPSSDPGRYLNHLINSSLILQPDPAGGGPGVEDPAAMIVSATHVRISISCYSFSIFDNMF